MRGPAATGPSGVPRDTARHAGPRFGPRHPAAPTAPPGAQRARPASTARALRACGVVLLAAACGASEPPARPAAAPRSPGTEEPAAVVSTPAAAPAGTAGPAGRPAAPAPRSAAPAAPRATGDPAPTDPPLPSGLPSSAPLRVSLAATCLAPGAEQRLVVETLPNAFVAFDNLYPDHRTGAVHGGAQSDGRSDQDGRFTAVWRVAPDTPEGRVRVDVGVSARSGSAITMTYYRLAASCA